MKIAPFFRRNFVEPVWFFAQKQPFLSYCKKLEASQFFPEEILLEHQWLKFKKMIEFVYDHNLYYRKRFKKLDLHPNDIKSSADVKKIPLLTKNDIRLAGDQLISNGFARQDLIAAKTGGSTGQSIHLYFTEDCSERRNACARRHDRWSGWEVGEPKGYVWGNAKPPTNLREKVKWILFSPILFLDTMSVTKEAVIEFSRRWKRCEPTLLFGHAHSLYLLANLIMHYGIEGITPKAIISSSMMLLPHERKLIEDVFMKQVFDRYGCEEVSLVASECEMHDGMHLNIDHLFVEFIREDGKTCESGECGNIIVTDLINTAMPLIRYQVEDIGIPSHRKCPCGRGLPLMDKVVGRTADFLIKKDGTKVAGISLIENTLTNISGIDQMQIIQENLDLFRIRIVQDSKFTLSNEVKLTEYFRSIFGKTVVVKIENVEKIHPETLGKYRFSICKVPLL